MKPNSQPNRPIAPVKLTLTAFGLIGLTAGCRPALLTGGEVQAQSEPPALPSPTFTATTLPTATATPAPTLTPSPSPWPTPTTLPTATPWPTPAAWLPPQPALPALTPLPAAPPARPGVTGLLPVSYSPPDGVDVFGSVFLRWEYAGDLAPDEFFDIKIKPLGSNDSVFVEWTKDRIYELHPWSGWQPGLYTWQIGIVQGTLVGGTKQFVADTGRDSQPFLIKWQAAGGGGGHGGAAANGGGGSGGNSGGS